MKKYFEKELIMSKKMKEVSERQINVKDLIIIF